MAAVPHLKNLRKKLRYSQAKLAAVLELSRSTVAQWERGDGYPTAETWTRIVRLASESGDPIPFREYVVKDLKDLTTKVRLVRDAIWDEIQETISVDSYRDTIDLPRGFLLGAENPIAFLLRDQFIRCPFPAGYLIVDPSRVKPADLVRQMVVAYYHPGEAEMKLRENILQSAPLKEIDPCWECQFPFLKEGLYVGWIRMSDSNTFSLQSIQPGERGDGFDDLRDFKFSVSEVFEYGENQAAIREYRTSRILGKVLCWLPLQAGTGA